jgi:hypothetical protein
MTKIYNRDVIVRKAVKTKALGVVASTGTASSGAVTLNAKAGRVTSESLTTAQNAIYTLTITNSEVSATSIVLATVANGTNTQGTPMVVRTQPSAGSLVVTVQNKHASSEALNGTLVVSFLIVDPA